MRPIRDILRSYAVFDSEGRHTNGTDKESNHRYGDAYEKLIADNFSRGPASPRAVVKLVMEVGVAGGECLLAWREVFPNALIVGMDVQPSARACGERIEFHLGDQRSQTDCERVTGGRLFDLIIDDATHLLEDTLRTFLYLWPHVRPGGIYVVEEFPNVGSLWSNIILMWPMAEIVHTTGPSGDAEPLVVFRKPV